MTDVIRSESGQFVKGVSGNPAGRPKGSKNKITELKQDLEVAVRSNVNPQDISDIVERMVIEAKTGNVQAAKLILDKTISNAKESEDPTAEAGGILVRIENATLSVAEREPNPPIEGEVSE
jgi:hypothetical protein